MTELWKPIADFEDLYEVSNYGQVRSLDRAITRNSRWGSPGNVVLRGRILKPAEHQGGHLFVTLADGQRRCMEFVHRLVLTAFVRPRAEGEECRHLDGNKRNNKDWNLCWGTRTENIADRKRLGEENPARGERSGKAVFTESDIRKIRKEIEQGKSYAAIGRSIGAHRGTVRKVAIGYTWGWLA